jgi:hypothetical protein
MNVYSRTLGGVSVRIVLEPLRARAIDAVGLVSCDGVDCVHTTDAAENLGTSKFYPISKFTLTQIAMFPFADFRNLVCGRHSSPQAVQLMILCERFAVAGVVALDNNTVYAIPSDMACHRLKDAVLFDTIDIATPLCRGDHYI